MNTGRLNAVLVGILFILGTGTGVAAAAIETPILTAPDYLSQLAANSGLMTLGVFLQFIMAVSCAGIGIALYPVMKRYRESQAIAVVGYRIMEGSIEILGAIATVCLLVLGREWVKVGGDLAVYQTIGTVIKGGSDWLSNGPMLFCWCIGAYMYYAVFYQYRLVPRWLSIWGLVGITLTVLSSLLIVLNILPTDTKFNVFSVIFNLPIAIQEPVFAVWLIVKGYTHPKPVSLEPVMVS